MYPTDRRYSKDHEWIAVEAGSARIGITDFAQQELGDIVYVAPDDPHQFRNADDAGEPFGFLCIVNAERDRPVSVDGPGVCHICE